MRPRVVRVYKNLRSGGGVQSRLLELLPRLAEHLDLRVLCYRAEGDRADELRACGVGVDLVPLGIKWSPANVGRYVAYLRAQRPDIVHTHEYTANTLGITAAARAGVPVRIRHIHSLVPWGWDGWLRTRLRQRTDRRCARLAQVTLAVSEAARRHYLEGLGGEPGTCRVLYNGIELSRFGECRAEGAGFRVEWGIPAGAPVVGIVGRLARGKGHRDFLRAAKGVKDRAPETRFLVVGDGPLRAELEAFAAELGLGGSVVFTGFRRDVPAALGAMDVFLCTSGAEGGRIQEGLTGAVIEAQAAGVPVVAFRLPMSEELLEDGTTGALVPEGDAGAMAEAALRFLAALDPDREHAAARARERAQRFSLDRCVEETRRLYAELLDGARRRP